MGTLERGWEQNDHDGSIRNALLLLKIILIKIMNGLKNMLDYRIFKKDLFSFINLLVWGCWGGNVHRDWKKALKSLELKL